MAFPTSKVQFKRSARPLALTIGLAIAAASTQAFDATAVPAGLYYHATNDPHQLWAPLVLSEGGRLIDPLARFKVAGLAGLEGLGKTSYLQANTAFLNSLCDLSVSLATTDSVLGLSATVFVEDIGRSICIYRNKALISELSLAPKQRQPDAVPTLLFAQDSPRFMGWIYGMQGLLIDKRRTPYPQQPDELGGEPNTIAGVVSGLGFLPQPIIEPNAHRIANLRRGVGPSAQPIPILWDDLIHRTTKLALTQARYDDVVDFVTVQLEPQVRPRLLGALGKAFGGVRRPYFEIGHVQGVDIDNTRAFDYAGIARIGVELMSGHRRWIDVAWVWRSDQGKVGEALQILRTSEEALLDKDRRFFSEINPSVAAPALSISAFADFDKDRRLEVVTSLTIPVGVARQSVQPEFQEPLAITQSVIHAWIPATAEKRGLWQEVHRTSPYEPRKVFLDPGATTVELFGR